MEQLAAARCPNEQTLDRGLFCVCVTRPCSFWTKCHVNLFVNNNDDNNNNNTFVERHSVAVCHSFRAAGRKVS